MKKLKLKLETIAILNSSDLQHAHGGDSFVIVRTTICPVILTNGCTGGGCVMTHSQPTTSVINPSGGSQ